MTFDSLNFNILKKISAEIRTGGDRFRNALHFAGALSDLIGRE